MTLLIVIPGEVKAAEMTGFANAPSYWRRIGALAMLGALLVLAILSPHDAFAQETLTIKSVAYVQPGANITIADVADVTEGQASSAALVLPGVRIGQAVTASDIRAVLEKERGVNLGHIRIRGGPCEIRATAAAPPPAPQPPPVPPAASGATRVRDVIPAHLARLLGVRTDDLRVSIETSDAAILDATIEGRTLSVHPTGDGARVPFEVRVFESDRLVASGRLRAEVLIRREVMEAAMPITRGTTLSENHIRRTTRWLPITETPADSQALGQMVRTRIGTGELIRARDVESPIIVKRGEIVSVDCISGGVILRTSARATQPARQGEIILLQSLNSKRTFQARVSAPSHAVLVLTKESPP